MRPRKARNVAHGLERKGFVRYEGDHRHYVLNVAGKSTGVRTKISHGTGECSRSILGEMAKDLHLSSSELKALLDCPLSKSAYLKLLCERGLLEPRDAGTQLTLDETAASEDE